MPLPPTTPTPEATTVQFIGSRDRLLFTWAALDSAIAAKGK